MGLSMVAVGESFAAALAGWVVLAVLAHLAAADGAEGDELYLEGEADYMREVEYDE